MNPLTPLLVAVGAGLVLALGLVALTLPRQRRRDDLSGRERP